MRSIEFLTLSYHLELRIQKGAFVLNTFYHGTRYMHACMCFAFHISHKLLRIEIENVVEMQSCKLISGTGNIIMYLSYYV